MNPPAYALTPVTRSASVTEHSWNKRPNYVRPYVSLPSFPRNPLISSHIQGSKIRASYISFAQKEKNRLEALVITTKREVTAHADELVRIKGIYPFPLLYLIRLTPSNPEIVDRTESVSAAALERRKSSRKHVPSLLPSFPMTLVTSLV